MVKDNRIYNFFPVGEIRPEGWVRKQLEIQADGLAGNLDKMWPDVRDSKWIGGDREGWERVPYWLDGFLSLAWLLDDADKKARAKRYIDAILDGQKEDGWICPCTDAERAGYDMWALFLIGKVLTVWYDCTGDERVENALYAAFQNFRKHINHFTLFGWASARWYECLIPLGWLYDRRPEEWMVELAHLLAAEGLDYQRMYRTLSMERAEKYPHWSYQDHVVNTAMALKSEAVYSRYSGEDPNRFARKMLDVLLEKHGMATGHFTGDECLSGQLPIQGSELCGVVEAMYSYEQLLAITGDPFWGDRLETTAFNALPAAISPDMWTHQYLQIANQSGCRKMPDAEVPFNSNNGEAHLFGLEPHFGCCTANFGQGWPKLAHSAFLRAEDGIAVALLIPGSLQTTVNETAVKLSVDTCYPFRDRAVLHVSADAPVEFTLSIRIPGWAKTAAIDGKAVTPGEFVPLRQIWSGETAIEIALTFQPEWIERPNGLSSLRRGALLYALPIEEQWEKKEYERDGVERKFPYCDYELLPLSDWNYGFAESEPAVEEHPLTDMPFSPKNAPLSIRVNLQKISWGSKNGLCNPYPDSNAPIGPVEEKVLIPYGCTNLRMTELPFVEKD